MLYLSLFGTGQCRYGDSILAGFPTQQSSLLLCYLILHRRRVHRREHLAAVFWGDYPTSTSRKYLRHALWRLRSALRAIGTPVEMYMSVDDDTVAIRDDGQLWLDTETFEANISQCQGRSGADLTPTQVERLEEVVALYTGDLLEGVYDDWCLYERERLHLLRLSTLSKLMDYYETHGAYELGLTHGEHILACDNTREKTHRQMMRLYWFLGDRNAAFAQYKRCQQILRENLNTTPMSRTRSLYNRMLNNRFPTSSSVSACEQDESADRVVQQALRRLVRLQETMERTRAELDQISQLIGTVLPETRQQQSTVRDQSDL
jgi:DNA-binding SARP family transcriptional activator